MKQKTISKHIPNAPGCKNKPLKGKGNGKLPRKVKQPSKSTIKHPNGMDIKPSKILVCQYCGKEFEVSNWRIGKAKYCSWDCSNKGRTTERAYSKERICKRCSKKYLPTQWNQKHCSRECFLESVRKRKKIVCPTCKKEFTQTRVSQKYCSRKCGEPFNKKPKRKFKKGYADLLWGELIKLKAGIQCEYCGSTKSLNSHHVFSRSNVSLRWDENNGICLCALHHVLGLFSAHKAPLEFAEWIKDKRGVDWYNNLRDKSKIITKLSNEDRMRIIEELKEKIVRLDKAR